LPACIGRRRPHEVHGPSLEQRRRLAQSDRGDGWYGGRRPCSSTPVCGAATRSGSVDTVGGQDVHRPRVRRARPKRQPQPSSSTLARRRRRILCDRLREASPLAEYPFPVGIRLFSGLVRPRCPPRSTFQSVRRSATVTGGRRLDRSHAMSASRSAANVAHQPAAAPAARRAGSSRLSVCGCPQSSVAVDAGPGRPVMADLRMYSAHSRRAFEYPPHSPLELTLPPRLTGHRTVPVDVQRSFHDPCLVSTVGGCWPGSTPAARRAHVRPLRGFCV